MMIYEMGSKSQKRGGRNREKRIKKLGEKRGRTFPSSRRRSYNKTIVFRANGARSNKGARCKSEGISQNNISQCPTGIDDVESATLRVSTIPRERLSAAVMPCREETRRLWIFDAVKPARLTSHKSVTHTTREEFLLKK